MLNFAAKIKTTSADALSSTNFEVSGGWGRLAMVMDKQDRMKMDKKG